MPSIHRMIYNFTREITKLGAVRISHLIDKKYDGTSSKSTFYNRNEQGFRTKITETDNRIDLITSYASAIVEIWKSESEFSYSDLLPMFYDYFKNSRFYDIDTYKNVNVNISNPYDAQHELIGYLAELLTVDADYLAKHSQPKTKPNTKIINIADNQYTCITQHLLFPDSSHKPSGSYDNNSFDFEFLVKHNRLLLTGHGGQGKTHFANLLRANWDKNEREKFFNEFVYVSLSSLVTPAIWSAISSDKTKSVIKEYIIRNFNSTAFLFDGNDEKILIFLDGYNELLSSANEEQFNRIRAGIDDLLKTDVNKKLSVIITSRQIRQNDKAGLFRDFEEVALSSVPQKALDALFSAFQENYVLISDNVKKLAEIPMYYNLMSECASLSEIKLVCEYDVFYQCYKKRVIQRLDDRHEEGNKSLYKYYAFAFLPMVAHHMINNHSTEQYYIPSDEFNRLIKSHQNDNSLSEYVSELTESINTQFGFSTFRSIKLNTNDILLSFTDDAMIQKDNNGNYRFCHEVWRDFLCAFSLSNNISFFKTHYNAKYLKSVEIKQNVNATAAIFTLNALGFSENYIENNCKVFSDLFTIDNDTIESIFLNPSNHDLLDSLLNISKWLNASIDMVEYLKLRLIENPNNPNEPLHQALDCFSRYFVDYYENSNCQEDIIKPSMCSKYIAYILTKECEYYRRSNKFEEPEKYIQLGERLSKDNRTELQFILNQHAKLTLCKFQYLIQKENNADMPQYFSGLYLLEENSKHNFLSANLMGMILTNPAPYLIKCGVVNSISYKKALCKYVNIIFHTSYSGREIGYTAASALKLIVNGYVAVKDDVRKFNILKNLSPDDLTDENCSPLRLNNNTLYLAEQILNRVSGQDETLLNYFRGSIALFKNDIESANTYLTSLLLNEQKIPGLKAHYLIRRFYERDLDSNDISLYEIKNLLKSIISNKNITSDGVIDDTHTIHYYLDLKRLVASYTDELNEFLDTLEQGTARVKELCNLINSLPRK